MPPPVTSQHNHPALSLAPPQSPVALSLASTPSRPSRTRSEAITGFPGPLSDPLSTLWLEGYFHTTHYVTSTHARTHTLAQNTIPKSSPDSFTWTQDWPPSASPSTPHPHLLPAQGFLVAQTVKNLFAMQETWVRSLGQERSPGEGNGNLLHYSCLENSMDREARQATVHGSQSIRHS